MKKVITYGTYDILHFGHIKLLERAKALGDYLIVGVTSDSFDRMRGKINIKQPLRERIEAIRSTGLADEIIIEEYEGQKIDDIRRYDIDIFTVGSDWRGKFDYLNEYCQVVYLERTPGVSSSELRTEERKLRIGLVGDTQSELEKFARESCSVNGVEIMGMVANDKGNISDYLLKTCSCVESYEKLLEEVDAVYIVSHPAEHFSQIKVALSQGKHVLCESPIGIDTNEVKELLDLAREKQCILMESLKTAYSLAFTRLQLLVKSGFIGDVISVDATCTSLKDIRKNNDSSGTDRGSLYSWGPFGLLAVFSILGTEYKNKVIQTKLIKEDYDVFTKINFLYDKSVATIKVANGVKSEGELVISGTRGYVYVPAPWWKTDYFEVRYENPQDNKRYFYQLEGEGIRYMIVSFLKSVNTGKLETYVSEEISSSIIKIMEDFNSKCDVMII